MEVNKDAVSQNSEKTRQEIISRLKKIIAEELDVNLKIEDIDEAVPLLEQGLALDSIVLVEFIGLIEHHFGIEFSESDLRMDVFKNLQVLAELIDSLQKNTE
jgi:acyl carrier protein